MQYFYLVYLVFNGKQEPHIQNNVAYFNDITHVIMQYKLGMLNSVFSCNRSSIVQNRILTEARSIPVDAQHAMSTESAMQNRKRRLT